jgi:hypothetical protein
MSERFPAGKPAQDILSILFILNLREQKFLLDADPDPSRCNRMNHPAIAPPEAENSGHALQI